MMILCKTVHILLGFPDPYHLQKNPSPTRYFPPPDSSRGLRYLAGYPPKDSHVVASPAVGRPAPRPDPGSWGLHEAEEGGGFAICTENLGSESCDAAEAADSDVAAAARSPRKVRRSARRRRTERRKDFPPPLPWLSETNGRRSCFMKGERKDGRFLLTEVTIERPEVLRASRQDGRLRLQLIESSSSSSSDKEKDEVVVVKERREMVGPGAVRCTYGAVGGNNKMEMWWGHRFVTTA